MPKETLEIIPQSNDQNSIGRVPVENFIASAIEKGLPVETIERLLAMRKELKQEWAKEEYFKALANFQKECPIIKKKVSAKDDVGRVMYKFADLDATISQTQEIISHNGFSYMFRERENGTKVEVDCIVFHKAGHSEITSLSSDLATKTRMMSSPQQKAATVTFLKRYTFWNAFGIMTGIEDKDASANVTGQKEDDAEKLEKQILKAIDTAKTLELVQQLANRAIETPKLSKEAKDRVTKFATQKASQYAKETK